MEPIKMIVPSRVSVSRRLSRACWSTAKTVVGLSSSLAEKVGSYWDFLPSHPPSFPVASHGRTLETAAVIRVRTSHSLKGNGLFLFDVRSAPVLPQELTGASGSRIRDYFLQSFRGHSTGWRQDVVLGVLWIASTFNIVSFFEGGG